MTVLALPLTRKLINPVNLLQPIDLLLPTGATTVIVVFAKTGLPTAKNLPRANNTVDH